MRRRFLRSLVVVAALSAMAVPVFNVTHSASACSQGQMDSEGNCTVTITGGNSFDTYISPLTATLGTTSFGELPTQAELANNATATVSGTVSFSVFDLRGNNQGFDAFLQCDRRCLTSPQFPSGVPASDFSVSGMPSDDVDLFLGDATGDESAQDGYLTDPTGQTLDSPVLVGGECKISAIGQSIYTDDVPVAMTLRFPETHILTLPISYDGNFLLTIQENVSPNNCYAVGHTALLGDF